VIILIIGSWISISKSNYGCDLFCATGVIFYTVEFTCIVHVDDNFRVFNILIIEIVKMAR